MPRKRTKPTRAEEFLSRWERPRKPIARGVVEVGNSPMLMAAAKLLNPAARCDVDAHIQAAVDRGVLVGTVTEIRADLALIAIMAGADTAHQAYVERGRPEAAMRRQQAAEIASALKRFTGQLEEEADALERASEKAGETEVASDHRAICRHGNALLPLLDAFAQSPPARPKGNATAHQEREFFGALEEWWRDHADDRRGAKAIRNRIAATLWVEFVAPGDEAATDNWAGHQFRDYARRLKPRN